jgi:DNA-binding LytR/AlgR family response regulator
MITCIIVDDEEHAIAVIQHFAAQISNLEIRAAFTDPIEALTFLNENKVDLVFLDIHMPEISGIDLIRTINDSGRSFILTTAYKEFALTGFDLNVVDYLIKPISLPRFLQAIAKAQQLIQAKQLHSAVKPTQDDYFLVKTEAKGKMLKINIAEIDFVEGMKNYVAFHHNGTRTLALLTMKDVEERLPKNHFIRVQKSFIVAVDKITSIDGNRIILKGISTEILIGDTYRKDFLDKMKQKLLS